MKVLIKIIQSLTYLTIVFLFTLTSITLIVTVRYSEQFGQCYDCTRSYTIYSHVGLIGEFGFYEKVDETGTHLYLVSDQIFYSKDLPEDLLKSVKIAGYDLLPNLEITTNSLPVDRNIYDQVKTTFILSHTLTALILGIMLYTLHSLLKAFRKGDYFNQSNHRNLNLIGFMIMLFPLIQFTSHRYLFNIVYNQDRINGLRSDISETMDVTWVLLAIGIMTVIFSLSLKKGWEIKQENELTI
jgi:hypothetical protein